MTWDWPRSVEERTPKELWDADIDLMVLQRPHELDLALRWTGRRPGVDVPAVYVEHNSPDASPERQLHPLAGQSRIPIVHVTHFNRLMWDNGQAPTEVVEHGIVDPGPLWTGTERRAAVVVNDPVRRGRTTGTDLLPRFARSAPLDVFGMRTEGLAEHLGLPPERCRTRDLPQHELHREMARCRVYLHPVRWTSLGLSLLEAMFLGMPVVALDTTEVRGRDTRRRRGGLQPPRRPGGRRTDLPRRARAGPPHRRGGPGRRPGPLRRAAFPGRLGTPDQGGHPMSRIPHTAGRVAMVSEHASPLAALGGPDAGGQNVYVAQVARQLARKGIPRHGVHPAGRGGPAGPGDPLIDGVQVVHVPAGPPAPVPKDELLPHMTEFGTFLARQWAQSPPDVVHAHFWMSGLAALAGARELGIPVVQTYHALGTVKKRYQGDADTSPPQRLAVEEAVGHECARIIATCSDEVAELKAMGLPEDRISVVPLRRRPRPVHPGRPHPPARRPPPGCWPSAGSCPRKGFDRAIRALADVPDAELLIAGGPEADLLGAEPEAARLYGIAGEYGVLDRVTPARRGRPGPYAPADVQRRPGAVAAPVRALRHRPAGGHGLRHAGRRHRRRRPARHGRGRHHGRPWSRPTTTSTSAR